MSFPVYFARPVIRCAKGAWGNRTHSAYGTVTVGNETIHWTAYRDYDRSGERGHKVGYSVDLRRSARELNGKAWDAARAYVRDAFESAVRAMAVEIDASAEIVSAPSHGLADTSRLPGAWDIDSDMGNDPAPVAAQHPSHFWRAGSLATGRVDENCRDCGAAWDDSAASAPCPNADYRAGPAPLLDSAPFPPLATVEAARTRYAVADKAARLRIAVAGLAESLAMEGNAGAAELLADAGRAINTLCDREAARLADIIAGHVTKADALASLAGGR